MPPLLDYALVLLAVAMAAGYLIWRKIRTARRIARDWATGNAESCGACPVIKIRQLQTQKTSSGSSK